MSVRLQFPRAGFFSFTRQFVVGGNPLDLTAATLTGYLKHSPDDDDADAIATLSVSAVDAGNGVVLVSILSAATTGLARAAQYYFEVFATIGSVIYRPEPCLGPVILTPLDSILAQCLCATGVSEVLTPEDTELTLATPTGLPVYNRPDLTGLVGGALADLDSIVTFGAATYPVGTIIILSYGDVEQLWKLVASTETTDVSAVPARVRPVDFNVSTNAVIWRQIG